MPCSHTAVHLPHPHLTPPSLSLPLKHSFCFTFLTLPHTHPSLTSAWSTPAIGSRDKKRNAFTLPIRRSCCKNSRTELNPYMYKLHSSEAYVCNYVNYTWMTVVEDQYIACQSHCKNEDKDYNSQLRGCPDCMVKDFTESDRARMLPGLNGTGQLARCATV